MDGEVDEYPEAAFNLVGNLDDAIAKGKKNDGSSTDLIIKNYDFRNINT